MAILMNPTPILAFLGLPNGAEWIALLVLGLLLFGRRLPEVGRSLGRSIVEFKRGIKGIEDEIEQETVAAPKKQIASQPSVGAVAKVDQPADAVKEAR